MAFYDIMQGERARELLRAQDGEPRLTDPSLYDVAAEYIEGRGRSDVESELASRYAQTQSGASGEKIVPVVLPLVDRYLAEAAGTYTDEVERTWSDAETGDVDEEATEVLRDLYRTWKIDEAFRAADEWLAGAGSCGVWFREHKGRAVPTITMPQNIHPVSDPVYRDYMDRSDVTDYPAVAVRLAGGRGVDQRFALLAAANHIYYTGPRYSEVSGEMQSFESPYLWPQAPVDVSKPSAPAGDVRDLPLQMFTVWNTKRPTASLVLNSDPDVVLLAREFSIEISAIMDTIRTQGFGQFILNLTNPDSPPASVNYGTRFAIPLAVEETAQFVSSAVSQSDIMSAVEMVIKLAMGLKRQNPNDFSISGSAPSSGFAKMVESISKLEMMEDHQNRLRVIEQETAWPRLGAITARLGKLPYDRVKRLRLDVSFEKPKFPKSIDEEIRRWEFEISKGASTVVDYLMERYDLTREAAEERAGATGPEQPIQPAEQPRSFADRIREMAANGAR